MDDTEKLENAAFHNGPFGFGTPENAAFVKGAQWAAGLQEPKAWLRSDGMKAMTADEKDAWLEAGRDDLVADYTIPLVAG